MRLIIKKLKPLKSNGEGFTLVELLVTLVIMGIVATSFAGLYYLMQIAQIRSQHLDLAIQAARTEIESLRNEGYDSLTPGQNINFTSTLPSSLPPNRNGVVTVTEPVSGLRRVDVNVTYTDFGKPVDVELSSDIGIIGIGQT